MCVSGSLFVLTHVVSIGVSASLQVWVGGRENNFSKRAHGFTLFQQQQQQQQKQQQEQFTCTIVVVFLIMPNSRQKVFEQLLPPSLSCHENTVLWLFLTLCNSTEALRFEAILVEPPPPPVDDAVRVDCLGVFLGFFGILNNFFENWSDDI
uniref:Uncharacterized protein n=1 Tax=Glossina pallidipes TaxID=7398 RepID=A0A1B0AJJ5_GLOPL